MSLNPYYDDFFFNALSMHLSGLIHRLFSEDPTLFYRTPSNLSSDLLIHSVIDFIFSLLTPYFDFLRTSAKPLQLHCLHRSASQVFLMWTVLSDDTHANQCGAPAFLFFFSFCGALLETS